MRAIATGVVSHLAKMQVAARRNSWEQRQAEERKAKNEEEFEKVVSFGWRLARWSLLPWVLVVYSCATGHKF